MAADICPLCGANESRREPHGPDCTPLRRQLHRADSLGQAAPGPEWQEPAPQPIEGIITAWVPMTNKYDLALIGKLGEEAAELAKACTRAMIQGLDGTSEGQEGRSNALEIRREFEDCRAVMRVLDENDVLASTYAHGHELEARFWSKVRGFRRWMKLLTDALGD